MACVASLAVAACGGSADIGGDYANVFAGRWIGTVTAIAAGQTVPTSNVALDIARTGTNALRIGDICPDQSGPPAVVTGSTTLNIGGTTCPSYPVSGCSAVTLAIAKGTGVLAGADLALSMDGTLSGCSRSFAISVTFSGTRTGAPPSGGTDGGLPPDAGSPPSPSPPTVKLRTTQYATTGETAALDASGSTGTNDAGPLTFALTLVSAPAGSGAALADTEAPIAHLAVDRIGDYVARVVVSQGALSSSGSVTLSVFDRVTPIGFRPVDAEYSRALDRLVAISSTPEQLHVFDPIAQKDSAVSLPVAGRCLSVSSDGKFAAVGHDGWVSQVDLSGPTVIAIWPVTADAGDVVISDPITIADRTTRFAYIFPSRDQWTAIHDVDLGNGAEKTSGGLVYAGMRARLQPGSSHIFAIDTGLSPQQMYRFDIGADGIAGGGTGSPYWGTYPMGLGIWISRDGVQILSATGNRFRTSDMSYAGKLDLGSSISSADWSAEAGRWIVQPAVGYCYSGCNATADTSFWTVDSQYLSSGAETKYPRFVHAGDGHLLHGRYVFYDSAGQHKIAVVQVDASSSLLEDYAVLVF